MKSFCVVWNYLTVHAIGNGWLISIYAYSLYARSCYDLRFKILIYIQLIVDNHIKLLALAKDNSILTIFYVD